MLRLFWHYVLTQAGRSIRLDQIWRKLLTQSYSLYEEQQIYLNLWSVDILSIMAEQVGQPDVQVGCLLGFVKLWRIF